MTLLASESTISLGDEVRAVRLAHPLRPILYLVFALKLAVAGALLANVALAPPLGADGRYLLAD
ncbi:hypothetical protein [Rhizobium sp. FY34]|uniref:hypothetical protein n=1 Tax=Rhizobium sp. FY34 TaxID=2562309 RepID=UPI0010C11B2A|nr:hypothetical protein [Rhizobium sp. FY34]